VKEGYYTPKNSVKLASFAFVEYTARSLKLQMTFEDPLTVTQYLEDPDKIQIVFLNHIVFFDQYGLSIDKLTTLEGVLPPMLSLDDGMFMLFAENKEAMESSAGAFVSGSIAMNFLLAVSLNQLFSAINSLQFMMLLALVNVSMPANASMFFTFVLKIAEFDVLPMEELYGTMTEQEEDPLYSNFLLLDLETKLFLFNIGSLIVLFALWPLLALLHCPIVTLVKCKSCKKRVDTFSRVVFWQKPIIVLTEAYTILCISVLVNLKALDFKDPFSSISSALTLLFAVVLVVYPVHSLVYLQWNFNKLGDETKLERVGEWYKDLNFTQRSALLEPTAFLVRRILIALTVIMSRSLIF
jgi:hypothetical protein